ncbi:Malonyl CoA-acyl carrier protein transacylase [Burkholderia singularis]|uniref:Malonyl CoA-acyl carrier protein transacylase n=2 Tax=Burkholderia singularis TaxID=1503053 RepID=A0A238H476_9BURK|nr:Malonyl CoA-acyl carrier protein transacylase [Burkholderia singularis]
MDIMNKPTLLPAIDTIDAARAADRARRDIAVIGLAGRYPMAEHLDAFWRNLVDGRDCVSPLPPGRWLADHPQLSGFGDVWGGFLDDVDSFDALFFGITPREAAKLDPQERLFLQCAYAAIEDAGYTCATLGLGEPGGAHEHNRVGVFAGAMYQEYQLYGVEASFASEPTAATGIAASIANRVSYFGGFQGPSLTLDTMCSSSITAIHLACRSLMFDECEAALAGGVNVSIHPNKYRLLKENKFLAATGRCRSFAADGDGYVPGEGVGIVVLKRLDKALRDGDRIHAVIKASAINHGGHSKGYYVPNARQQAALIHEAIELAGVDPRHIQYVEAHGTGTPVGDPVELQGLTDAFSAYTSDKQFCALGSVKSNIGHSESAAGIAALTKVILQMKNGMLVPSLHAQQINPALDFAASPFYLQRSLAQWPRAVDAAGRELPRLASLSSYGAGGSNAHLIVAEHVPQTAHAAFRTAAALPPIIVLSAPNPAALRARAQQLLTFLREGRAAGDGALHDCAYTLQVGRDAFLHRVAFVAHDVAHAQSCLDAYVAGDALPQHVHAGKARAETAAVPAAERDAQRIARAWVDGAQVDWADLHRDARPRRISLPTYPFASGKIWMKTDTRLPAAGLAPSSSEARDDGHPLLHRREQAGDAFASHFSVSEPFLADHQVDGRPMLPAVAYLEMARAAFAARMNVGPAARVADVTWMRPARADGAALAMRIAFSAQHGERGAFVVERIGDGTPSVCATGRVDALTQAAPERIDVNAFIVRHCDKTYDADACYRRFAAVGLQYGPAHQIIAGLHAGPRHVVARLSRPQTDDNYWLHPSIGDGALQSIIGFYLDDARDWVPVPFSLARADLHRRCGTDMWCIASRAEGDDTFDIALLDAQGELCARFDTLKIRNFARVRAADAPSGAADGTAVRGELNVPLAMRWVRAAWQPQTGARPALVWQIGGDDAADRELAQYGARRVRAGHDALGSIDACAALLEREGPVDEIVWIAPSAGASEDIARMQQHGVGVLFRLAKALIAQGYLTKPLAFTIVTHGAQAVLDDEPLEPTHASVHGFVGVLAKEMRAWRFRLVDLDLSEPRPMHEILSMPFDRDGEAWSRRAGTWYRQQLLPCCETLRDEAPSNAPVFRQRGVYVIVGGAGGIGKVLSRYLIDRYDAQVVWLGRRGLAQGVEADLAGFAAARRQPAYWQVDATDAHALARVRDEIVARFGAVHGVINSAIVLRDQGIMTMDEAQFSQVLDVKVATSVNVASAFGGDALDFMLFFSSLAGYLKMPGQSNYAAGSVFQDTVAHYLGRAGRFPVKVMNWGYWSEFGAGASEHYRRRMAAIGVASVRIADSMAALEQLLRGSLPQMGFIRMFELARVAIIPSARLDEAVEIVDGRAHSRRDVARVLDDAQRQLAALRVDDGGVARAFGERGVALAAVQNASHARAPLPAAAAPLANASPPARGPASTASGGGERRGAALAYMKALVSRALEVPLDALDESTPLVRYGVDSISAVHVTSALNERFGDVDSTLLFDLQTIEDLADHFLTTHPDAFPAHEAAEPAAQSADPAALSAVDAFAVRSNEIGPHAHVTGHVADAPRAAMIAYMKTLVANALEVPFDALDESTPLVHYGVDSISGVHITNALGAVFDGVDSTLLFDLQTIEELADHFLERDAARCAVLCAGAQAGSETEARRDARSGPPEAVAVGGDSSPPLLPTATPAPSRQDAAPPLLALERDDDIAIVGMSGRYPEASDLRAFWANLRDGVHCIREIPASRWDWRALHTDDPETVGRSYSRWGGFIDGHDEFDPDFFHIAPAEAELIDPQERLFLQYAYACIEDAGHTPESLNAAGEVGVFAGAMNSDYPLAPRAWSIANRVSYVFDFQGPSMTIDTACSSSLTALHLATEALHAGTCASALVGGVNLITDPAHLASLSYMQMLSRGDACRAFGDGADGFVASEGVGVVLLKPLRAAKRDGDHVYGVVKGTMVAAGGRTSGYTVPSPRAQSAVIERALARAGVDADSISYVEAHGTGTALGDPIEVKGLTGIYGGVRRDGSTCALGSVKSNIGHAESAAGLAGLTKILLQMKHGTLVPTLHAQPVNPRIDFARTPFRLPLNAQPWARPTVERDGRAWTLPRIAGLSSFGAGGANAHAVIAEANLPDDASLAAPGPQAIVLSAQSREQVRERASALLAQIRDEALGDDRLHAIAFTLQVGREMRDVRLGFVVDSIGALATWLARIVDTDWATLDGLAFGSGRPRDRASTQARVVAPGDARSLNGLVADWAAGERVDWNAWHIRQPRRISLPTYPFKRERYWLAPSHDIRRLTAQALAQADGPRDRVAPPQASLPCAAPPADAAPVYLYRETWRPQAPGAALADAARRVLCIVDTSAAADALAPVVAQGHPGADVLFIVCADAAAASPDRIALRGEAAGDYRDAFAAVRERWPAVDVCYHALAACDVYYCERDHALLYTIQGMIAAGLPVARLLLLARCKQTRLQPQVDSWIGLCRSLPMVLPQTDAALLACHDTAASGGAPFADWFARRAIAEARAQKMQSVLYRDGVRHVADVEPLALPDAPSGPHAGRAGQTWLVTGGMGALATLLWHHLHAQGANVVLTGRSALDAEQNRKLDACDRGEGRVLYVQADAGDEVAMRAAIQLAKTRFGRIDGVIHAAGIAPTTTIESIDFDDYRRVLAPKVHGARVLTRLAEREGWRWLVQFSSSSAVLGDFGSCSYAVANRFQTAHALAQPDGPTRHIAINWPLWRDGSMGLGGERRERVYLASSGQDYLETHAGLACFERILAASPRQAIVLVGDGNPLRRRAGMLNEAAALTEAAAAGADAPPASPVPATAMNADEATLRAIVLDAIETQLKLPAERVRTGLNWVELGFDSIRLAALGKRLGETLGVRVTPATFFANPSVDDLIGHLAQACVSARSAQPPGAAAAERAHPDARRDAPAPADATPDSPVRDDASAMPDVAPDVAARDAPRAAPRYEPIAVIGMSGRFPGAESIDALWRNWADGVSGIRAASTLEGPRASSLGVAARERLYGGFLDDVEMFDPLFFELSPNEAAEIDPQQRLFLQTAWHAFEDAGYVGDAIRGSDCGVFVGAEESLYGEQLARREYITANRNATLPARIAYALDLKGPNCSVTASCSSGLVAVHQACRALQSGECSVALAGAVSVMASARELGSLAAAIALAAEPACRVFDDRATGLVPAEAVAAVVLKPLSRALADGDRVHGVIRGTAINYDGRTNGMLAPNPASQVRLFRATLDMAGLAAEHVGVVLAHSIGMRLGDSVEIDALQQVFRAPCALTSTKPVLGHSFAASGVVDLLALMTALRHRSVPALHGFETANEYVDFSAPGVVAPVRRRQAWDAPAGSARYGFVSTTGINGANACAIVEEAPPRPAAAAARAGRAHLVVLSAPDAARLAQLEAALRQTLDAPEPPRIEDIAFTLLAGRAQLESRVAWVVTSRDELRAALDASAAGAANGYRGDHPVLDPRRRIAWPAQPTADALREVAAAWAAGAQLDGGRPDVGRRITLPTTPFARISCWAARDPAAADGADGGAPASAPIAPEAATPPLSSSLPTATPSPAADPADAQTVRAFLRGFVERQLGFAPSQILDDKPLRQYGMDSVLALKLGHALESRFRVKLTPRTFHENPSIAALVRHIGMYAGAATRAAHEAGAFARFRDERVLDMLDRIAGLDPSLAEVRELLK